MAEETCEECENGLITETCVSCNGSGEGSFDGSTCSDCHGIGNSTYLCSCEKGQEYNEY